MSIKVDSFFSGHSAAAFTLSDGSIRMVGEAGREGAFGFYSKGCHSYTKISPNGVIVGSISNKYFHAPPQHIGHIVKCVTMWGMTFAIDNTGRLYAWGTFKKRQWDSIPFDRTFKNIMCVGWGTILFTQTDGTSVPMFLREEGPSTTMFFQHAKSFPAIKSAAIARDSGYMMGEDGSLLYYWDKNGSDSDKSCDWKCKTVSDCIWASFSDGSLIYRDGRGVHIAMRGNNKWSTSMSIAAVEDKESPIHRAVASADHFTNDNQAFLLDDNSILRCINGRFRGDKCEGSITPVFEDGVKQFDCNFVLTNKGVIIPISDEAWSRTDMVLSAFDEWADDEDIVYGMCKIAPRNFLCASNRLRKDVDFCKKIAQLGPHAYQYIDGMVRRNRELRPYKHMYAMAGDR
jgi:hypothetical protein